MNEGPNKHLSDPLAELAAARAVVDNSYAALDAAIAKEVHCLKIAAAKVSGEAGSITPKQLLEAAAMAEKLRKQVSGLRLRKPPEKRVESEFIRKPNAKPHPPARLSVTRASLLSAAVPVLRMRKARKSGKARVTFADGQIAFDFGESAIMAPAKGHWPGFAIVPAKFIFSWLLKPDSSDPVEIQVMDREFYINRFHTLCHWESSKTVAGQVCL